MSRTKNTVNTYIQENKPRPVDDNLSEGDLTLEEVRSLVPNSLKKQITKGLVDKLNKAGNNPYERDMFRRNFIGFSSVLKQGRYTSVDYINAIKYCSFRMSGDKVTDAYKKAFPDRVKRMIDDGMEKDINVYAAQYNKGKLVNAVFEQTLPPAYLLNVDVFQEAINVQAHMMRTADSEKVRSDAAACLIKELKAPEKSVLQVDMNVNAGSEIDELREITRKLAQEQLKSIEDGKNTAAEIAGSVLLSKPDDTNSCMR